MKMTKRDQILIAVIGVIAIVGGFYWFVVKPAKADLGTQKDTLSAVRLASPLSVAAIRSRVSRRSLVSFWTADSVSFWVPRSALAGLTTNQ